MKAAGNDKAQRKYPKNVHQLRTHRTLQPSTANTDHFFLWFSGIRGYYGFAPGINWSLDLPNVDKTFGPPDLFHSYTQLLRHPLEGRYTCQLPDGMGIGTKGEPDTVFLQACKKLQVTLLKGLGVVGTIENGFGINLDGGARLYRCLNSAIHSSANDRSLSQGMATYSDEETRMGGPVH